MVVPDFLSPLFSAGRQYELSSWKNSIVTLQTHFKWRAEGLRGLWRGQPRGQRLSRRRQGLSQRDEPQREREHQETRL